MEIAYKTFFLNQNNQFSIIVNQFLVRQVYLDGIVHVTPNLKDTPISLAALHSLWGDDGISVVHNQPFEVISSNRNQFFEDYENFQFLIALAQSVENFETYLKKIISTNQLQIPDSSRRKQKNMDRVKSIKKAVPKVNFYLNQEKYRDLITLFQLLENIRHIIIHSQGMINDAINIQAPEFRRYFSTKEAEDSIKVTVTEMNAHNLLAKLSELAYIIFKGISEEKLLPITEKPRFRWQN